MVPASSHRSYASRWGTRPLVVAVLLALTVLAAACANAVPSASGGGSRHATTTQGRSRGHDPSTTSGTDAQSGSGGAGGSENQTTPTFPKNTTYSTVPAPQIKTATVTVNGKTCPVPREISQAPIDPVNDSGGQIAITDQGVLPFNLNVNIGQAIVWTNLTSGPVRVQFNDYPVTSPVIPPCGTFTYTFQSSYDFSYRTTTGHVGTVEVGAFQS